MTEKNELKLIDFQISAGRTTGTEIACEMYPGYSAPEQYSSAEWQGTWTDVYGISATLYRVLTGCVPAESISRLGNDNCPEPMVINRNVPSHVSKVIMNGLKLNTSNRIQTITELVVKLFEQPKFNTAEQEAVRPVQRVKRIEVTEEPEKAPVQKSTNAKGKKKKQNNKAAIIATIIVCGVIIIGFGIAIAVLAMTDNNTSSSYDPNYYSAPESTAFSSAPETTAATTTVSSDTMPDIVYGCPTFTGALFTSIQDTYNFVKINAEYKFDDTVANGIVISQSIKPDTEITEGTEIKLVVSKGPSSIALPDYTGLKVDEYTAMLSQRNVKFEKKETGDTNGVKAGYVVKCSKKVGEKVDVANSETVTVYYAKATVNSDASSKTSSVSSSAAAESSAESKAD